MEFTNFIPQAPLGYINRQNLSLENINQKKKKLYEKSTARSKALISYIKLNINTMVMRRKSKLYIMKYILYTHTCINKIIDNTKGL